MMLDNLRAYFARIRDEDLALLGLESVSLLAAMQMAGQTAGRVKSAGDIGDVLARWRTLATHEQPEGDQRRFQPLLEELLLEAGRAGLQSLSPDDAALLFSAQAILRTLPNAPYYDTVRERLAPHETALAELLAANPPHPGLPQIEERVLLMCPRDFELSATREVRKIANIPVDFRGKVLTVPSRVKVIGSIPDGALLVVEDGTCWVEGFVQGMVASREACHVQENIAGMIIAREGDISARKIIDRARVVAKWGCVHCQAAAAPALVFAGRRITITGDATRGDYRTREMAIGGRVLGCQITVTRKAEAARFVHNDRHETAIVLKHTLEAQDYGEELDIAVRRLWARAARLKQRLRSADELARYLATEVDQEAHTVLLYLSGGDDALERVEHLERQQRRVIALNRVILGLHQLSNEVEDNTYAAPWDRSSDQLNDSVDDNLAAIIEEIYALEPVEPGVPFPLEREVKQIEQFRTDMQQLRSNRLFVVSLVTEWRRRLRHWLSERDQLLGLIQQTRRELGSAIRLLGSHAEGGPAQNNLQRLREVLTDEVLIEGDRAIKMRVNGPFVRLMRRTVNLKLERLRDLRIERRSLQDELDKVHDELRTRVHLGAVQTEDGPPPAATGRFDAGVRLCTDPLALDAEGADETVVVKVRSAREEVTTFQRTDTGIVEVA